MIQRNVTYCSVYRMNGEHIADLLFGVAPHVNDVFWFDDVKYRVHEREHEVATNINDIATVSSPALLITVERIGSKYARR